MQSFSDKKETFSSASLQAKASIKKYAHGQLRHCDEILNLAQKYSTFFNVQYWKALSNLRKELDNEQKMDNSPRDVEYDSILSELQNLSIVL